ncbi:MAG: malate synthase A, partial [Acidimicrobiia bacterium]|nr:malate synthase A [Acidimicrobiia bacterium]
QRPEVAVTPSELLDTSVEGGTITEQGIRTNINVGILYIASWLMGNGAAALYNLMEDAATAEISRSQIWQWAHNRATTDRGIPVTPELVHGLIDDEMTRIESLVGPVAFASGRYQEARHLFEEVALAPDFIDFLTLPAYELIN